MVRDSSTGAGAVRAPAAFDLASGHIVLVEVAPAFIDDPQRPRAYNAAAQSEYARLAGMSPAALTAVMETYLPIACVINLLCGAAEAADPAHRSGPALGGLNFFSLARAAEWPVEAILPEMTGTGIGETAAASYGPMCKRPRPVTSRSLPPPL